MGCMMISPRRAIFGVFKSVLRGLALSLLIGMVAGGYLGVMRLAGNFHTTVPGQLYRSAQPTPFALASYQRIYGIKTIINLRGKNAGRPWYDAEVAAASRLGITHLDFRMSARQELSQSEAEAVSAMLHHAEKPILIHCEGGADRSGLIAALYVAAVAHGGEEAAEAQISIRYGHISWSANPAFAM